MDHAERYLSIYKGRIADCTSCGRNGVKLCEGYDPANPAECQPVESGWLYPNCSVCSDYAGFRNIRHEITPPNPPD